MLFFSVHNNPVVVIDKHIWFVWVIYDKMRPQFEIVYTIVCWKKMFLIARWDVHDQKFVKAIAKVSGWLELESLPLFLQTKLEEHSQFSFG